jgi:DNA-binding GntR family transcriptional regulator
MADAGNAPDGRNRGRRVERVAPPPSLAAIVTDQIRELIVTSGLALGEQLCENTLAEQLNVSRTPVRKAVRRLATERLIEVRPQRGTFVFDLDTDGIRALCELREALETGALRLAWHRQDEALVQELQRINAAAEVASARSAAAYQPLDHAFHQTLIAGADNPELLDAYARVAGRVRALRYRYTRTVEEVQHSQATHRRIVAHLAAGDVDGSTRAMREHVHDSLHRFTRRQRRTTLEAAGRSAFGVNCNDLIHMPDAPGLGMAPRPPAKIAKERFLDV